MFNMTMCIRYSHVDGVKEVKPDSSLGFATSSGSVSSTAPGAGTKSSESSAPVTSATPITMVGIGRTDMSRSMRPAVQQTLYPSSINPTATSAKQGTHLVTLYMLKMGVF